LTDSEAFGGGTDWKWTNGEVFDFVNWAPGQPDDDAVGLERQTGTWVTAGSESLHSYVIEYETHSPVAIHLPSVQPALLPGPAPRAGAFGIREVANNGPIQGPQANGSISGALRSLQNIAPGAIVRDYYSPVVDHNAEIPLFGSAAGVNRPFEILQRGDLSFAQNDDFAMIAHGQIVIPEGQGGDWTFSVNSDDGFELYIPGARFEPVSGEAYATQYGSLLFPYDRAASDSLGQVTLQPGVHNIELIFYENQLYGTVELSAARGRKTNRDQTFALVGAPAQNVVGRTPWLADRFSLRQVQRMPNDPGGPTPTEEVKSLTDAKSLLGAPDANDLSVNSMVVSLNHDNIPSNFYGRFKDDAGFISGNDVAIMATANLVVATEGTYTFGFSVLDGAELTITGARFNAAFGEGIITGAGRSLTLDHPTGDGVALATVSLPPGTYPLEFLTYNRDGDSLAELFVAPGRVEFFDAGAFTLLGPTPANINYVRPAGLQLVPEPATLTSLAAAGLLVTSFVAARRLRQAPRP
jgi:hypothetical protein